MKIKISCYNDCSTWGGYDYDNIPEGHLIEVLLDVDILLFDEELIIHILEKHYSKLYDFIKTYDFNDINWVKNW